MAFYSIFPESKSSSAQNSSFCTSANNEEKKDWQRPQKEDNLGHENDYEKKCNWAKFLTKAIATKNSWVLGKITLCFLCGLQMII